MPRAFIVIGLGNGDEGKGSWVDHLVRLHGVRHVVRFNGGAQARHHVVTPDGRMHGFAQFSSGTFVPGVKTVLSRFMLIDPESLLNEAGILESKSVLQPLTNMIVSENAPVITPFNRLQNRIMEVFRGGSRHGSCGYGIGITQGDVENFGDRALYVRDLTGAACLEKLLFFQKQRLSEAARFETSQTAPLIEELRNVDIGYYLELFSHYAQRVQVVSDDQFRDILSANDTVFEGAQGVLLDQRHGFFPHCTRSNCTFVNAELLLEEAGFTGDISRIGLLRGYATRHGAGPFPTAAADLDVAPCFNGENPWQGVFRTGWFDAVAARYALDSVGGVDTFAITNLDRLEGKNNLKICRAYSNADPRFFSRERILPIENSLSLLAERTASMDSILPEYESIPGWRSESFEGFYGYLDRIGDLSGRRVDAVSTVIGPEKTCL